MELESPDRLRRQLRADLGRQVDKGRIKHTNEKIPELETIEGGLNELICRNLTFISGARLDFKLQLKHGQRGSLVKQFQFHIKLPDERKVKMVRIHLNVDTSHDPLKTPRCHFHVDDSKAHVPFPTMNPRLILDLICEHIERDFGT
jgi:hypothetical protein